MSQTFQEIGPDDVLDRNDTYDDEIDPFYEEWNRKMQGFHPSSLLSLDIAPKSSELFYENIKNPGTLVRGMYYTLSKEEELLVKLVIKSPSGRSHRALSIFLQAKLSILRSPRTAFSPLKLSTRVSMSLSSTTLTG